MRACVICAVEATSEPASTRYYPSGVKVQRDPAFASPGPHEIHLWISICSIAGPADGNLWISGRGRHPNLLLGFYGMVLAQQHVVQSKAIFRTYCGDGLMIQ